jgi:hypothetical protein
VKLTNISNVAAIAAGYTNSVALDSKGWVWTWGANFSGQLGYSTGSFDFPALSPGLVIALTNQHVVAITGGDAFTVAATSNGSVYAWGDNSFGELGTYSPDASSSPLLVPDISNVVIVCSPPTGKYVLAKTSRNGTNQLWGWGRDDADQVGTGPNGNYVDPPAGPLQFCDSWIQLGTNGTFTAPCTGTLTLYFNDDIYGDDTLAYTVTVYGVASDIEVDGTNYNGVAVGTVYQGSNYNYTATGWVDFWTGQDLGDDDAEYTVNASGYNQLGVLVDCDSMRGSTNGTGATRCWGPAFTFPGAICYSLVGKIQ